ncbi:hypothetical protein ABZP36_005313, partial [Zizania latifolia]
SPSPSARRAAQTPRRHRVHPGHRAGWRWKDGTAVLSFLALSTVSPRGGLGANELTTACLWNCRAEGGCGIQVNMAHTAHTYVCVQELLLATLHRSHGTGDIVCLRKRFKEILKVVLPCAKCLAAVGRSQGRAQSGSSSPAPRPSSHQS